MSGWESRGGGKYRGEGREQVGKKRALVGPIRSAMSREQVGRYNEVISPRGNTINKQMTEGGSRLLGGRKGGNSESETTKYLSTNQKCGIQKRTKRGGLPTGGHNRWANERRERIIEGEGGGSETS